MAKKSGAKRWMQKARKRMEKKGTVGAFSKAAEEAGMEVQAFAKKVLKGGKKYSTTMKRRAAFAKAAAKIAKRRRKK